MYSFRLNYLTGLRTILCTLFLLEACARPEPHSLPGLEPLRTKCAYEDRFCLLLRNDTSKDFEVERILVVLDGKQVFFNSGNMIVRERVVFSGDLPPGEHVMQVNLLFSGQNGFSGYHFEARSAHIFDVAGSKGPEPDRVVAVAYENATVKRAEDRLGLRFVDDTTAARGRPARGATIKIWISTAGDIELNGQPADLYVVEKAIVDLAAQSGTALYALDAAESALPPRAVIVMEMLSRNHLKVQLSTRKDFSDIDAKQP